jgi:predicted patatin/cPLA2 family phospholipase
LNKADLGVPPADLLDILRRRRAAGSRTPHHDGASIALAVEGGAMRGVISAGMVSALEDLGYINAFDAIYGASAGAINAAYFLGGQARVGTTIYHDDINNRHFIDPGRALRGRPIVDLSFLLDDVATERKPLNVARVLASRTPLYVLATNVTREAACVLHGFPDKTSLFGALRAGATMPVIAGDPFAYDGDLFLDASLTQPIPVRAAEQDGHTHVLVLLTRGYSVRPRVSAFDRYFVYPRLRRISPHLAEAYLARAAPYSETMRAIEAGTGPLGHTQVLGIRVDDIHISKLERRSEVLRDGAGRGYEAVRAALDPSTSTRY